MTQSPVGLIGLGLMGIEIAHRLMSAGRQVLGYDSDIQRRSLSETLGVQIADSPQIVWQSCQQIVLSLPTDGVVAEVVAEAELVGGQVVLDTTTGSPESTELLAERLRVHNIEVIDATISGSSAQLRGGTAVIIAGATDRGWREALPILSALSPNCFHVGSPGAGARMKLVTNLVLGLNRAALAEGLAYAAAQGLDLSLTLKLLKATPAYSRMMETKGEKMIERDFTPQAKLSQHLKDVNLIIESAHHHQLKLPLSEAHRTILQAAQRRGYGEMDNSALITAYDK